LLADDHSIIRNALRYIIEDMDPSAEIAEAASFDAMQRVLASESDSKFGRDFSCNV
jgi:DNA-binding NarL/FixJ family response regulator